MIYVRAIEDKFHAISIRFERVLSAFFVCECGKRARMSCGKVIAADNLAGSLSWKQTQPSLPTSPLLTALPCLLMTSLDAPR